MFGSPPWALWQIAAAAVGILLVTLVAWRQRRARPWLLVGWLLFIGMLAPVIGLLQVGAQGRADRFSYIPAIGLLIVVVWALAELIARWSKAKLPMIGMLCAALILFAVKTSSQILTWRDSDSLYQHTLAVTDHNWRIHHYYANYLFHEGRRAESMEHLRKAEALVPDDADTHVRIGFLLAESNDFTEARDHLERATTLEPENADAWFNLGCVQLRKGDLISARHSVEKAMSLAPENASKYRPTLDDIRARLR